MHALIILYAYINYIIDHLVRREGPGLVGEDEVHLGCSYYW